MDHQRNPGRLDVPPGQHRRRPPAQEQVPHLLAHEPARWGLTPPPGAESGSRTETENWTLGGKKRFVLFSGVGVHIARRIDKLGMRSSDTAEVFFEDVRVPCQNVIGQEGLGFTYQMLQFQEERLWAAANSKAPVLTPADPTGGGGGHFSAVSAPASSGHDGDRHPGDHPVHAAEEDLQSAGPPPPGGSLPVG